MKKIILSLLMFLIVGVSQVAAHGGRLDSDGGHYNRKTGKYHTHREGANLGSIALIAIGGIFLYGMCKSKDK